MKSPLRALLALTLIACGTLTARAQTAPTILTVDMAKLFDGHWKTKEQLAKLHADEGKAQAHADELRKEGNDLVAQLKGFEETAKNPATAADAKAKAQEDAQKVFTQIQQKKAELTSFGQDTETSLRQRSQAFRNVMVAEIAKVAVDIAKKKGATLLLDKAGPTMIGISNILYSDPALDITAEVQATLDKDRPADAAVPATSAAPTPTTAPAATDSPQITVPGISK
jgi:outer membrane protein